MGVAHQSKADDSFFIRSVGSAAASSSRYAATSRWPYLAANISAVRPSLLAASTGLPSDAGAVRPFARQPAELAFTVAASNAVSASAVSLLV